MMPISPDARMTAAPAPAATPPWDRRNAAVITIATAVGTAPNTRPAIASSTERVSNTTPGSNTHGVSMIKIPIDPIRTPMRGRARAAFRSGQCALARS